MKMHVLSNQSFFKIVLVIAKFRQHAIFFANIFVRTVLTDLLHHVNNCIYLSTLRGSTISNTVMCTLPIFSVVKSNLFIRALLLDRILVTEKTTRTPRVHLVNTYL